jgi:integrase/recombinase XerD
LTYSAVYDLVCRLRRRTGIDFDPHWYRHTAATRLLRDGVPLEVVSKLLGHVDITTTSSIYGHLTVEDARKALEAAGWFSGGQVRL